jgi:hypothetical protein
VSQAAQAFFKAQPRGDVQLLDKQTPSRVARTHAGGLRDPTSYGRSVSSLNLKPGWDPPQTEAPITAISPAAYPLMNFSPAVLLTYSSCQPPKPSSMKAKGAVVSMSSSSDLI